MSRSRSGFTLIELSIVLVIIGLIAGGIMVGRDLIAAASIRGTISQINKYQSAVNTFRTKYNAIPGDMKFRDAQASGFFTFSGGTAGTTGFGDGNMQVEGGAGAVNCSQEALVFWRHLSQANLIDGNFGASGNAALDANGNNTATLNNSEIDKLLPKAKLEHSNYITANYGNASLSFPTIGTAHHFVFFGLNLVFSGGLGCSGVPTMTPIETNNIDTKMDDGLPNGGVVNSTPPSWTGAAASGNCTYGGTTMGDIANVYNANPATGGNDAACNLWVKF